MTPAPSSPPFAVLPFTDDNFFEAVRSSFLVAGQASGHRRARYMCEYLKAIDTKTILVEHEYTDGAYLDDYAHYYVKSFANYSRRCRRLHFFSRTFSADEVRGRLLGDDPHNDLQASYLGFIVVRPLPEAIIGRTAVATYPPDGGRRNYPVRLEYEANLFGTPLKVRSLAFQEQDTVLAACATVALWTAFQKCADLFGTVAPSPAEITRFANTTESRARALPSRGLTLGQMCRAISSVGLEPEVFNCSASLPLSSLLYAYVSAGLPVVLVVDIEGLGHAITINGFSLRPSRQLTREDMIAISPPLHRIGLRIDEVYGHDDQVGPFARLKILDRGTSGSKTQSVLYFSGSWFASDGTTPLDIEPRHVIVPVYHKIRVTFVDIQRWITAFNHIAALVIRKFEGFEWDVRLTTINEFKGAMRRLAPATSRERLLFRSYPRFLWRAILGPTASPVAELVFDATDMAPSYQFCEAVFYDDAFRLAIRAIVHAPQADVQAVLGELLTPQFLEFLRERTA